MLVIPIGSMCGIFTYIYQKKNQLNVGKIYKSHGSNGIGFIQFQWINDLQNLTFKLGNLLRFPYTFVSLIGFRGRFTYFDATNQLAILSRKPDNSNAK